jgi:hypothetical protein
LLNVYEDYEPFIKFHKQQWELNGLARKRFESKHKVELVSYDLYRNRLKSMIKEPDKKILAGAWRRELATLEAAYEKGSEPYAKVVTDLASVEVLQHNKKDLERMLENESHKKSPVIKREEQSL